MVFNRKFQHRAKQYFTYAHPRMFKGLFVKVHYWNSNVGYSLIANVFHQLKIQWVKNCLGLKTILNGEILAMVEPKVLWKKTKKAGDPQSFMVESDLNSFHVHERMPNKVVTLKRCPLYSSSGQFIYYPLLLFVGNANFPLVQWIQLKRFTFQSFRVWEMPLLSFD